MLLPWLRFDCYWLTVPFSPCDGPFSVERARLGCWSRRFRGQARLDFGCVLVNGSRGLCLHSSRVGGRSFAALLFVRRYCLSYGGNCEGIRLVSWCCDISFITFCFVWLSGRELHGTGLVGL